MKSVSTDFHSTRKTPLFWIGSSTRKRAFAALAIVDVDDLLGFVGSDLGEAEARPERGEEEGEEDEVHRCVLEFSAVERKCCNLQMCVFFSTKAVLVLPTALPVLRQKYSPEIFPFLGVAQRGWAKSSSTPVEFHC